MDNPTTPQDSAAMPPASDCSACEPVAWVAFATDASESRAVCLTRQDAENVSSKYGWEVAPLYAVRLTDAEREAVERGYCSLMGVEDMSAECSRWDAEAADTLRGLLERTK